MLNQEIDRHKKFVLLVLLYFTIPSGIIFSILNYFRGQELLAAVEFITASIAIVILYSVYRAQFSKQIEKLALTYVLMLFTIMIFAFSTLGVSSNIFIWAVIIPSISYLLLGVNYGFLITLTFYTLSAWMFFRGPSGNPVIEGVVSYTNVFSCTLLLWGLSHSYEYASQSARKKLRKMAICDHLTGLYNRTTMSQLFGHISRQAEQNNEIVSMVLFDLDSFKSINDQFGHDVGDQVLIKFARILQSAISGKGMALRIGGEEFATIFSAQSDLIILSLAENVRRATEKIIINEAPSGMSVSVSAGVATSIPNQAVLSEMMVIADRRMYQGKSQGRNVVIHKG